MIDFEAIQIYIDEVTPQPCWSGQAMIVDAKNLLYRLAHREPDATGTALVFLEKLVFLREWYGVERLVIGWEGSGRNWRFEHLPDYKGHRDYTSDLSVKVEAAICLLDTLLRSTIFEQATTVDAEGDDVFGTLASQLEAENLSVAVYSTDRDLWQLATDRTTVIVPIQGEPDIAADPSVVELHFGVRPTLIPDLKGLQGDAGDNIPGVSGVGPKVALELVTRHGDFASVIAAAQSFERQREGETKSAYARRCKSEFGATSSKLEAVASQVEQARASYKAGAIRRDVPITLLEQRATTLDELRRELERLGAGDYAIDRARGFVFEGAPCNA